MILCAPCQHPQYLPTRCTLKSPQGLTWHCPIEVANAPHCPPLGGILAGLSMLKPFWRFARLLLLAALMGMSVRAACAQEPPPGAATGSTLDPPLPRSRHPHPVPRFTSAAQPAVRTAPEPLPAPALAAPPLTLAPLLSQDRAPVTLHLDDVDVRKALELLSRQGPLNILVSANVTGTITANLDGISFDQALNAILKLSNLVAQREGGLVYVYTPQEVAALDKQGQRVVTRVYRLCYLRGSDLEKICTPLLTPVVGRISITPISEIGIKSNTDAAGGDSLAGGEAIIVQDYECVLETLDQIIAQLDVQPVQVLIEAVILEVFLQDQCELGVNFAVLDHSHRALAAVGNAAAMNAGVGFDPAQVLTAGGKMVGTASSGFSENAHGLKFGFVDKDITGFVRALSQMGETNVLACPRLLVLNKQRAELIIGDKIGYKTLAVTETSTVEKVEFLNVGTQLRLRPFVAHDGMIRLEIHPERSSGSVDETTGIPRTTTSEVTTNVMVPEGCTIVIGGLMEDHYEVQQTGIPGLCKLPWIGALFRNKIETKSKKELIVLLTPRTCNSAAPPLEPLSPVEMLQQAGVDASAMHPHTEATKQPRWIRR